MKRILCILCAMLMCVGCMSVAMADDSEAESPFFQSTHWKPEDVDVSGVREVNGRLVGVVKLPTTDWRGVKTAELRVDCPVPTDFTQEQSVALHIGYQKIIHKQLMAVLKEIFGKIPAEDIGTGYAYNDRQTHVVCYDAERGLDGYCLWIDSARMRQSNDPVYDVQYEQARDAVRQVIEHFGGTVSEDVFHAARRDAEHLILGSSSYATDATDIVVNTKTLFDEYEKKNGRASCEYTMVKGLYELRGLPVMDQYYWWDGRDWTGAQSSFQAAVRDDGTLRHLEIDGLPVEESAEPIALPEADWRALLRQAVAKLYVTNAIGEDFEEEGRTLYAQYSVITELEPCWVSKSANTLVPGWCLVSEDRVVKDDSVHSTWTMYGDYQGLMEE